MTQEHQYSFSFPLNATYIIGEEVKSVNLGSLDISGWYKIFNGEVRIKNISHALTPGTTVNNLVEWLKNGGDIDQIEPAAELYIQTLLSNDHTLQLIPQAIN